MSTSTSSVSSTTVTPVSSIMVTPISSIAVTLQQQTPLQQSASVSTVSTVSTAATTPVSSKSNNRTTNTTTSDATGIVRNISHPSSSPTSFRRDYEAAPAGDAFVPSLATVLTHLVSLSPAERGQVRMQFIFRCFSFHTV